MKKYFNISLIFTILFIISCGDVENGTDGLNTVVDVRDYSGSECSNSGIEINVGLDDDGDGFLGVTVTNDVITSDVVNNGTISVEKLISGDYVQLPFTNYFGETSTSYGFSLEGYYMYSEGQVDVVWGSTYLFNTSRGNTLIDTWSGTYKIRVVSPS